MAFLSRQSWRSMAMVFVLLSLLGTIQQVPALQLQYCSPINTANTAGNFSQFQSNGLCYGFCQENFSFAILQTNDCWCSDFAPSKLTTLTDCDTDCPGYPDDKCASEGLFAYISLTLAPSGTASGPTSSPTSQVTVTATAPGTPSTVFITPTPSRSSTTSISSSISSSDPPTTTPPSTSSTWTPTPTLSLTTVTNGQVKTVTITPTAPPSSAETVSQKSKSSLSNGAIIGISVTAVVIGGALLGLMIWLCLAKRRKNRAPSPSLLDEAKTSNEGRSTPGPSRTMSGNSRFVLETNGEKVVQSFVDDGASSSRRASQMLPVDPRLDPFNRLYQTGNQSRDSVATIRDEHDYSRKITPTGGRVLRAMNPDE